MIIPIYRKGKQKEELVPVPVTFAQTDTWYQTVRES